ncbi:hypothetical protein N8991_03520 [Schleiferiaceae bacterium]|nr:hypothetical protein [Schleiferiaceae bacterium]
MSSDVSEFTVLDVNFSELLRKDLWLNVFNTSTYRAWMIYFSISEMKMKNVEIENVIDWNENQLIDRSLNLALSEFFPDAVVKGYRCFSTTDRFIYLLNSDYEVEKRLSPNELHFGFDYKYLGTIRKIADKIKSIDAPNLRTKRANLQSDVEHVVNGKKLILFATPISSVLTAELLDIASLVLSKNDMTQYRIEIKLHPNFSSQYWIKKYPNLKDHFIDRIEYLGSYDTVISAQSSLCLEAYMSSCKVAILCKTSHLDQVPFYFNDRDTSVKKIYDYQDLVSFLNEKYSIEPVLYSARSFAPDYKIF